MSARFSVLSLASGVAISVDPDWLRTMDPATVQAAERVRARVRAARAGRATSPPARAVVHVDATGLAKSHASPDALAAAVGARVELADARRMRAQGCEASSIRNPRNGAGPHLVILADDLSGGHRDLALLHEIGHILLPLGASEEDCDGFAIEFMLAAASSGCRRGE